MIFFFAGPHKNGTHLQMLTATTALEKEGVAYRFLGDMALSSTRVFQAKLSSGKKILDTAGDDKDGISVCKAHWGAKVERDLLLSYPDIRIFLIWRDPKDVLVSSFHYHRKRFPGRFETLASFYRQKGRGVLLNQVRYRRTWREVSDDPRVFEQSYEDLVSSFETEAPRLLGFAGLPGTEIEEIHQELSMENLRRKYKDDSGILFRHGKIGDHQDEFDSPLYEKGIERMQRSSDAGLWVASLIDNPRVILKRHFPFPMKRFTVRLIRLLHRIRSSRKTSA